MIFTSGQKKTKRQQRRIEDAPRTVACSHLISCFVCFFFLFFREPLLFYLLCIIISFLHQSSIPSIHLYLAAHCPRQRHHTPPLPCSRSTMSQPRNLSPCQKYKGFSLNFTHTFIILRCVTTIQNLLYFKTEEVKYKQVYFYFFLFVLK